MPEVRKEQLRYYSSRVFGIFLYNGIVVGNLTTADPDADNSHTYTLVDDAGGRFAISGNKIVVAMVAY
ncbi:MAG: hypothetical protein HC836_42400 [Richelia sp. RM2_1_2]|nr:hypothetical protein [Richelia sp. RM2_1_2]